MLKIKIALLTAVVFAANCSASYAEFFNPTVDENKFYTHTASVNDVGTPAFNFDASKIDSLKTTSSQLFTAASSNKLEQAANSSLTGDNPVTICGWVNFTSRSGVQVIASKWDVTNNKKAWQLYHDAATNQFKFSVSSDGVTVAATATASTTTANGTWYFVRAWHDPATDQIGVQVNNGTKATASVSTGMFSDSIPLTIGAYASDSNYLDGKVDSLSVYTTSLSDGNATSLYNSGNGLSGSGLSSTLRTNLYDHWDMKGVSGDVIGYVNALPLVRTGSAWDLGKVEESPTSGEVITKWTGQVSSSHTFTQATLANMPIYQPTGVNSLYPGVYFDGVDDRLQSSSNIYGINNNKPGVTVFIVMNLTIEGQYDYIFQIKNSWAQDGFSYILNTSGNQQRLVYGKRIPTDSYTSAASISTVAGGNVIETIRVNWRQRLCQVFRNEVSITNSTTFGTGGGNTEAANANSIYLGNPATSNSPKMSVAQFLVYDRELSTSEISYVTKILQKVWGF